MDFNTYQQKAYATAIYPPHLRIMYPALGLTGEAGEVANKIKKIFRDDGGHLTNEAKSAICKELGGCLWYIAAIASDINVSLDHIARQNLEILESRATRGTLKGSGDNR